MVRTPGELAGENVDLHSANVPWLGDFFQLQVFVGDYISNSWVMFYRDIL
jgi:hypothetical protein